jgi:hypothetical protein
MFTERELQLIQRALVHMSKHEPATESGRERKDEWLKAADKVRELANG